MGSHRLEIYDDFSELGCGRGLSRRPVWLWYVELPWWRQACISFGVFGFITLVIRFLLEN